MSLPLENLDNKTFEQLVEEAKKRIPVYAPGWTDHNLHDPGITLIELFAWLLEMQIYRLNIVSDDAMWTFLKLVCIQKASKAEVEAIETKAKAIEAEAEAIEVEANIIETLDQAVIRARKDMKTVTRAVTPGDYETLALSVPGDIVKRAKAIPRYHPNMDREVPGIVTVIVAPAPGNPVTESKFLEDVFKHLKGCRLLTTRLFVTLPFYIAVSVKAFVVIKPGYLESTVAGKVKEALASFLDPLIGGKDGNGWPFGRTVYVSELYEVIDGVEGVDYVKTVSVKQEKGIKEWQHADIPIPRHALVRSGSHDITASEEEVIIKGKS